MIQTSPATDYVAQAAALAAQFAATAAERDRAGGTALGERQVIRASGLLKLLTPVHLGGLGADWLTAARCVREIARADASLAHVFGYHFLDLVTTRFYGTPQQVERAHAESARNDWFWGNAVNPLDPRLKLTRANGELRLDGVKSFCSGATDSDRLVVSAVEDGRPGIVAAVLPTGREGITVLDDWDNMGQRQTDSGTVTFDNVPVHEDEMLSTPGPGGSVFASLRACLTQNLLTNVFVGIGLGALDASKPYTQQTTRSRTAATGGEATTDPAVLAHYGEMWVALSAAAALADRAIQTFQAAWDMGDAVTPEMRGQCMIDVSIAKVAATRASLDVTTQVFEVMGARATSAKYGFDRFWRNARTLTLHDPVDAKIHDVGEWVLNGRLPTPGFYS